MGPFFQGICVSLERKGGGCKKLREVGRGEGELGEESARQREQQVQRLRWGWFKMQASRVAEEPCGPSDWSTGDGGGTVGNGPREADGPQHPGSSRLLKGQCIWLLRDETPLARC